MDLFFSDVEAAANALFLSGNWVFLGMVALAIIIGVFFMRNFGQLLCGSLLALVALGVIWLVYNGATSETPSDLDTWTAQLNAGWASLQGMSGGFLAGALVTLAIVIGVIFLGRSLIFRG